jgi:DNA-binding NarL/FixJ family response regulator
VTDAPAPPGDSLRVLVVDEQSLFRTGLRLVLSEVEGIDVVGEATDGYQALERARELQPDVVVMEVRLPVMDGIETARHLRREVPATSILMLTVSDDESDLFQAVKAGANGYLLKEVAIEELAEAVRAVGRGHGLISPPMASKLLQEFSALARRAETSEEVVAPSLTAREGQILRLVARGLGNRAIADELSISENTVKNHVRNILEKLRLHSRKDAVMYAVKERLLALEEV